MPSAGIQPDLALKPMNQMDGSFLVCESVFLLRTRCSLQLSKPPLLGCAVRPTGCGPTEKGEELGSWCRLVPARRPCLARDSHSSLSSHSPVAQETRQRGALSNSVRILQERKPKPERHGHSLRSRSEPGGQLRCPLRRCPPALPPQLRASRRGRQLSFGAGRLPFGCDSGCGLLGPWNTNIDACLSLCLFGRFSAWPLR